MIDERSDEKEATQKKKLLNIVLINDGILLKTLNSRLSMCSVNYLSKKSNKVDGW